jgi:hypothetical protein
MNREFGKGLKLFLRSGLVYGGVIRKRRKESKRRRTIHKMKE